LGGAMPGSLEAAMPSTKTILKICGGTFYRGSNAMIVIGALVTLAAVWAVVLWGSIYFNQNVV
jgi:hypothetical protein